MWQGLTARGLRSGSLNAAELAGKWHHRVMKKKTASSQDTNAKNLNTAVVTHKLGSKRNETAKKTLQLDENFKSAGMCGKTWRPAEEIQSENSGQVKHHKPGQIHSDGD